MCERTLQVLEKPVGSSYSVVFSTPAAKNQEEMYLCGLCGLNLDRNMPSFLLEMSVIACPNCGDVNKS